MNSLKEKNNPAFLLELILKKQPRNKKELEQIKRSWARQQQQPLPRNSELWAFYSQNPRDLKTTIYLRQLLQLKKIRTLSGVVPLALFTKPYPCGGRCVYCPLAPQLPRSYLPSEPAIRRAGQENFDPRRQVKIRLQQYQRLGHPTDKIELIIKGGSWSAYPWSYRQWFVKECFIACNLGLEPNPAREEFLARQSLAQLQKLNEEAPHRIVGINIETRPNFITAQAITELRFLGVTTVELGVQTLQEEVLRLVRRDHGRAEVIQATQLLKEAGFKISYHLMPNLPGSNPARDRADFVELFNNPQFRPDRLKIYPCVVLPRTILSRWYREGKYQPYAEKKLISLLQEIKLLLPPYVRVDRLGRDIPRPEIEAGFTSSNIRELVQQRLHRAGQSCLCIRCREIKGEKPSAKLKISSLTYSASGGKEIFLQWVDEKKPPRLYSLLRLRLGDKAWVRELHTFGPSLRLGDEGEVQHRGLGKLLLARAEQWAREQGYRQLRVIAGVGVRPYYRAQGYYLQGPDMVKDL